MRRMTIDRARRIALGAQGFAAPRPQGRIDRRHFRRVVRQVGLVQLDSVNVCIRAHYMPFYARLGPYDRHRLDGWLNESREVFEYWAHEAAVLPVDRYPLWRWKMETMEPWKRSSALLADHPGLVEDVIEQVRVRGPLTVRDLEAPDHRTGAWWGYGPGKAALEVLFAKGRLSASRTSTFMRLYDLPERRIPADLLADGGFDAETAQLELLRHAVRHHGIGTVGDLADYFRLRVSTSRALLSRLAEMGQIEEVEVPGWRGPVYLDPEVGAPNRIVGATLLSPFDPVMWCRDRVSRLFGFEYRIEIYVPEDRRVHGYYVLPFLLDGELVARVDLKADRAASRLVVRSAFVEEGRDTSRVARELGEELTRFAGWLELSEVEVGARGSLADGLARSL